MPGLDYKLLKMKLFQTIKYLFFLTLISIPIYLLLQINKKEAFTPKIREMYRPYVRNSRLIYENTKNSTMHNLNVFLRNLNE